MSSYVQSQKQTALRKKAVDANIRLRDKLKSYAVDGT